MNFFEKLYIYIKRDIMNNKKESIKTIAQQLNVTDFPFKIKDNNNNVIYWEDSDGDWWKKEFDSNNNKIYFEDSDGYWVKREYDSNNNEIYWEGSNGFWIKREYDSNNNEIYYENSEGGNY